MKSLVIAFFVAWCFSASPAVFSQGDRFAIDSKSNQQYNWIVFVDAGTLKNYMSYSGSKLNPVDQFVVTYRQTASQFILRGVSAPVFAPVKYEEFWYHTGAAIGLRRYNELPVPKDLQGALYFRAAQEDKVLEHPLSAANLVTRLLLEIHLNNSIVAAVLVPDDAFDQVAGDLEHFNFLPVKQSVVGGSKSLSFRLESYPLQKVTTFYYASAQQ